jgi:nucleoside 2-deoxyribosyltransferase
MQVYFAAPLFCEAELRFNERVASRLEDAGHDVFLPQRDGMETTDIEEGSDTSTKEEMMDAIFDLDQRRVGEADVLTAVLDGRTVDEGVALEIGLAYAWKIPVVGLRTDRRTFGLDEPVNAMIWGACEEIVASPDRLVDAVAQYG